MWKKKIIMKIRPFSSHKVAFAERYQVSYLCLNLLPKKKKITNFCIVCRCPEDDRESAHLIDFNENLEHFTPPSPQSEFEGFSCSLCVNTVSCVILPLGCGVQLCHEEQEQRQLSLQFPH